MLSKWCEVSSCCGIIDLYNARGNKRHFAFWAIIMTCMLFASIWFTYRTIQGYIDTPSVTNVVTISTTPLDMPEVLLCYNGGLNAKKMQEANLSVDFITNFTAAIHRDAPPMDAKISAAKEEFDGFLKKHDLDVKKFVDMFSFDFREVFEYSKELCNESNNALNCSFQQPLITTRGRCFMFTNNAPQYFPTVFRAMMLILKQPNGSVAELLGENGFLTQEFLISLESKLGNQESGRSFLIPMNSKTKLVLSPKRYKRLGLQTPCESNELDFTSNMCFYNCCATEANRSIGCVPLMFMNYQNTTNVCSPFVNAQHSMDYMRIGECTKNCPSKCDEWLYDATVTSSFYAQTHRASMVLIGYETMQYIQIEEVSAFTIDMAIANVGGQSGLWLGLSMVTIVQAVYYAFLSLCQRKAKVNSENEKIRVNNIK